MPRIELQDPFGYNYRICTRQTETILKAWFDEVLPYTWLEGRPGTADDPVYWPRVNVSPMWAWGQTSGADPDWLTDSRAMSCWEPFPARNGEEGLKALLELRQRLERECSQLRGR